MQDDEFCQFFLYTLVNLICFLLSTIFLTSLRNVKSQLKLLKINENEAFVSFGNSYTGIAVLFSFHLIGFVLFMFIITCTIIDVTDKITNVIKGGNKVNEVNIRQNNNVNTEERLNNNDINIHTINNINNSNNNKDDKYIDDCLFRTMLFIFIFCQLMFFLEVIILTVYHSKSKDLQTELLKEIKGLNIDKKYFTVIYRDLIIVGYIFLFIFILFDLYTFIILKQFGRKIEKNNNNVENLDKYKYCSFFSNCLRKCCTNMAKFFHNLEREDDEHAEQYKKEFDEANDMYNQLDSYSIKLENFNNKIKSKKKILTKEYDELNLPKCDK